MIRIEEIVPLRGPRPAESTRMRRRISGSGSRKGIARRSIFRIAAAAGTGLGLAALGVFPPAREALADGYNIKGVDPQNSPCMVGGYAENHNCSPGCGSSSVCSSCCGSDGWHKDGIIYSLRPNQCWQNYYDGWLWTTPGCGCSVSRTYRCHDGWFSDGYTWYPTICRWTTSC